MKCLHSTHYYLYLHVMECIFAWFISFALLKTKYMLLPLFKACLCHSWIWPLIMLSSCQCPRSNMCFRHQSGQSIKIIVINQCMLFSTVNICRSIDQYLKVAAVNSTDVIIIGKYLPLGGVSTYHWHWSIFGLGISWFQSLSLLNIDLSHRLIIFFVIDNAFVSIKNTRWPSLPSIFGNESDNINVFLKHS